MDQFLQLTVVGLVVGCVYALAATGLVVTYTTSGVFNFAHGAVAAVAAFGYWDLAVAHHWPHALAALFIVLVVAPLGGAIVEVGVVLGVALLGSLVVSSHSFVPGMHIALVIAGAAYLVGCVLSLFKIER